MKKHPTRRAMVLKLTAGVCAALLLCEVAGRVTRDHVILNLSTSAPRGVYLKRSLTSLRIGQRVLITPAEEVREYLTSKYGHNRIRYLIKTVDGLPGEWMCGEKGTFHMGRDAKSKREGPCQVIQAGFVFVRGQGENSYDSRFFGPVPENSIKGEGVLLVEF